MSSSWFQQAAVTRAPWRGYWVTAILVWGLCGGNWSQGQTTETGHRTIRRNHGWLLSTASWRGTAAASVSNSSRPSEAVAFAERWGSGPAPVSSRIRSVPTTVSTENVGRSDNDELRAIVRDASGSSRELSQTTLLTPAHETPEWQDSQNPAASRPLQRELLRPLTGIDLNLNSGSDQVPRDRSGDLFATNPGSWSTLRNGNSLELFWEAPNISYRKLYFEDVALERYGQTRGGWNQIYRSTCHWGTTLFVLPLRIRLDPYYDCDTPYGYCRPGECVSPIWQRQLYR